MNLNTIWCLSSVVVGVVFGQRTQPFEIPKNRIEIEAKEARRRAPTDASRECPKLDSKPGKPDGDAGNLISEARSACKSYQERKLSAGQWAERIIKLEERAAFVEAPAGFAGLVPFSDAALFGGYDSYSLFLFPSREWQSKKSDVRSLHTEFSSFGDAIGDRRVAIWFNEKDDTVDVRRSKLYCDRFGLDYNNGPYVITLQKSPAVWRPGDLALFISLSGVSTERSVRVLNALEQDLRTERELKQRPLLFLEIRERLLSAVERHQNLLEGLIIKAIGELPRV